ncbi:MAG TPA: hypothetical protein PLD25_26705 [Chloroflexota bacterium]|nr:hypothetical protein [Chloroflexota bacterium]HUM67507.1 hypothetical protein [Chloroflexota bacterium]
MRIELDGCELVMRPASRALFLYLLLHRHKYLRREALAALFWGESDDAHAGVFVAKGQNFTFEDEATKSKADILSSGELFWHG